MKKSDLIGAALDVMHYSGAAALARPFAQGRGVIFCLHQVLPGGGREQGFAPNAKLECTPEFLESLILLARRRGYETVALGEAVARLQSGSGQRFAAFTLDDGFRDNRLHAQPVFKKLNCPYTIFVCPRFADGTGEIWWRLVELIAAKAGDEAARWQAWTTLYPRFEAMEQFEQRRAIRAACAEQGIDADAYCRSVAMDWDELKAISQDPLCTIGAHTLNHHAVGRMAEADAREQLAGAKAIISARLGRDVRFNAYPYGDADFVTARDYRLAGEAGFAASVTTHKDPCQAADKGHLQALPRIMVSGRYQNVRYVDTLLSGLPTLLSNGLGGRA
jgi:peptidoglycan/xylan/chitin deacetylase (PgdA/CDA1 family)